MLLAIKLRPRVHFLLAYFKRFRSISLLWWAAVVLVIGFFFFLFGPYERVNHRFLLAFCY